MVEARAGALEGELDEARRETTMLRKELHNVEIFFPTQASPPPALEAAPKRDPNAPMSVQEEWQATKRLSRSRSPSGPEFTPYRRRLASL